MKRFSAKPKKICEILGISHPTLRKLTREKMSAGEEYFVVGRTIRYDEAAIAAWTKNQAIAG
ncbi:helix-turn-helix domain-containing protein [Thermoleptolyngbya sp. M55_K2018_002]|uniref:helix-turn-helix domain-containing protein n=1 Tax=Thermoleptolyngbya sp. M55_K2018_002 TaxID=2747808 RepID=UPI0019F56799|nr:helix-turn-helix domain-containing protein [Thermoleptolyngbya sp. M55_K2018_002]HIK38968.1 helix-turn-helix domain-containing protein [Thermoleptolyngbya sp. M55_K2018_002]